MKYNSTLGQCLMDKSYADYQRSAEFVEVISILQKFEKVLKVTSFGFTDLEEAFDYEERAKYSSGDCKRSELLRTFFLETLRELNFTFIEFKSTDINAAVFTLLQRWNDSKKYFAFNSEILTNKNNICELSPIEKLHVMRTLLNAIFFTDRCQRIIETWHPDSLRICPLIIDKMCNKLWYFGDTYLFCECNTTSKNNSEVKPKRRRQSTDNKYVITQCFDGEGFILVCRTVDDWNALINAYECVKEMDVAIKLSEKCEIVRSIENARLKAELRNAMTIRTSSRVQKKMEEKKRLEDEKDRLKEEEKRQRQEEMKSLLEAKFHNDADKKYAIDKCFARRQADEITSREKRRLQRERRKFDLQKREHENELHKSIKNQVKDVTSVSDQNHQNKLEEFSIIKKESLMTMVKDEPCNTACQTYINDDQSSTPKNKGVVGHYIFTESKYSTEFGNSTQNKKLNNDPLCDHPIVQFDTKKNSFYKDFRNNKCNSQVPARAAVYRLNRNGDLQLVNNGIQETRTSPLSLHKQNSSALIVSNVQSNEFPPHSTPHQRFYKGNLL